MKSLADGLPPEIARQIHPDRRKNEAAYWALRDQLLDQYRGQWIGFADGRVVASGTSPVAVFHAAEATGLYPFFICVGREEEPCRIRRATFLYDASYPGEAGLSVTAIWSRDFLDRLNMPNWQAVDSGEVQQRIEKDPECYRCRASRKAVHVHAGGRGSLLQSSGFVW